jgi:DNA-binding response OmpR family regulator
MRVLIIEDDRAMAELLRKGLQEEHHVVSAALDGRMGLELASSYQFDVIVLDWMLPGIDGLEVMRRLRKRENSASILMLTARDSISDTVRALDFGADDYLTKPFSFSELSARLRAVGRRHGSTPHAGRLAIADLMLDTITWEVSRGGREIRLTPTEYRMLEFLMRRIGKIASRRSIVEAVWGLDAEIEENTLDAFVHLLRNKIDHGYSQTLLHTIRGFGFSIKLEPTK